jgi:hypothetical protein
MGTGVLYMKGKYDEETKSYIYTGEMVDPMSGKNVKTNSYAFFFALA